MNWSTYYERFYDLAPSSQKSYTYKLSDYGPADEVCEVIGELACEDENFAARFAEKALAGGVRFTPEQVRDLADFIGEPTLGKVAESVLRSGMRFTPEQVIELSDFIEEPTLGKMAERANPQFTIEQLEEIEDFIDDDVFMRIFKNQKIKVPREKPASQTRAKQRTEFVPAYRQPKKPGFFTTLLAAIFGVEILKELLGEHPND